MSDEANKLLDNFLNRLQKNVLIRKLLAFALLCVLAGIAAYFVYDIYPRQYTLSITGGNILSNRHFMAKVLQEEVADQGMALEIQPTAGSQEALSLVSQGKLDLAFIQGGLDLPYENVVHVATVAPELLHFLVREDIGSIDQLRGKRVNMGSKKGGTRVITREVLHFSGLEEGIDYVESNLSAEELLSQPEERLPEAIVLTSFAPSDIAEYMIKKRGYRLLEIPFPSSLALRYGWVADTRILAFMYNVAPAVPAKDIKTVGVNLHLVANKHVEPRAIAKILSGLYGPDLQIKLNVKMDEKNILDSASYPIAEGTKIFMERNNPFFSNETLDKIKSLFGLVLSVGSTLLVVIRWFKGEPIEPEAPPSHDKQYLAYIAQLGELDQRVDSLLRQGHWTLSTYQQCIDELTHIKVDATALQPNANLTNPQLPLQLYTLIADARRKIEMVKS